MLTFLFGRPGSGKTNYIINEIKSCVEKKQRCYLLVPEQQAYISECMLADLPPSAALCFEVVTFSRLCSTVFGKYGGLTDAHIGSGTRQLIMWHSLRELSANLRSYKYTKNDAALSSMFLSTIDELRANSINADTCEKLSEQCNDIALSDKLSDVAMLYQNFNRNLEMRMGDGAIASENKLSRLAGVLSKNDFFKGSKVFIDSFTSFTYEENSILSEIISQADSTCISIPLSARGVCGAHEESISKTVKKLTALARERSIEKQDVVLENNLRATSEELRTLEEQLWNFSLTTENLPQISEDQRGSIEMYKCSNDYDEIRLAALKIIEEHSKGKKFSEIALIMRSCDEKKGIIDAIFSDMKIPYFYSERTDLSTTPVARLVLSALRCISYGFRNEDVICLLKTGLFDISSKDADMFEDYCRTWNISGSTFTEDVWSMNPDGYVTKISKRGRVILESANRTRRALIDPLVELRENLHLASADPQKSCSALYTYLQKTELSSNLSKLAELELLAGNVKEAGEILRTYDFLVNILTEISTVLENTTLSCEELSTAIEIMLKHTDIGSVPAMNDYVTVGSANMLRVEGIKTAILVGLCEGEFPAGFSERGLIAESDKRLLEEMGVELESREDIALSDELYFVYRAMTKPSEKLILSTRQKNVGGGSPTPSSAWMRVLYIFDYLKPREFDHSRLLTELLRRSRSDDKKDSYDSNDVIERCKDDECNVSIDPVYARLLLGEWLHLSKSQISTFAECPYKYWCEYVLRLRESKTNSIGYSDAGTIIHYVLENFIASIKNEDGSLQEVDDESIISSVNKIMEKYVSDINCHITPSTAYSFSRLRDMALIMVKSVIDEFADSSFKVLAMEQPISNKRPGALKPMEIKVFEDEDLPIVSLGGVIDRIDCYDNGLNKYIRIVDYKTGSHKYNVEKIESGEDLQLPAYLFTAASLENAEFFGDGGTPFPAAALFLSADEQKGEIIPVRSGFIVGDEEVLYAASKSLNSKILAGIGINKKGTITGKAAVPKDEISTLNDILKDAISNTAQNIYSGNACRTPSESACKFCTLRASCPVAIK